MTNILFVFAMPEESHGEFEDQNVLYSGIGKVNASYALTKRLANDRPDLVINCGTAGSTKHPKGSVINCTQFLQRDMDVSALGFEKFQTPFSERPIMIEYANKIDDMTQGLCASGDSFDTTNNPDFDAVDMEAFALADICERENVAFLCLKYISDGADDSAHEDWNTTLTKASKALRKALEDHHII